MSHLQFAFNAIFDHFDRALAAEQRKYDREAPQDDLDEEAANEEEERKLEVRRMLRDE